MTRRDFQLIAARLAEAHLTNTGNTTAARIENEAYAAQRRLTAHALADALAGTNPKFDRARFLSASGVQS